ncbi:carboxypeptidase-like regulatory domain-containing protein [Chitinophaga sp. sic0106]|uniref:carboxypeptidase-like regulatory domain-containing protein n=1 Tax=Chitinophaga sp. sic0106 TaxID=2854785 RepID=UPI001C44FDA6|nr:carboxypeptidase-like regulatory domain-containing protein [Chitinophaga sp. sic0106]MBV7533167.1 carboxypeptidase-like regulatory domain-containing protein [Chitinophaga sp. sic0106]
MRRIIVLVTLLTLISQVAAAQEKANYILKGIVLDSNTQKPIQGALIGIRTSKSSITTSSDKSGAFTAILDLGEMTISISQYGYHNKTLSVNINDSSINLGTILLKSLSFDLNEYTVKGKSTVARISKDTMEFKSISFEVKENAQLKELLEKIPGLEVFSDGTITYNGQKIEKILLDGQDYFGTNIFLALRSISAELIDKLQIITTDNVTAGLGLINGLEKTKILNLTIKDSQKNKNTGNVQAGYGTSNSYLGNLILNQFGKKKQLSFLTNIDNINNIQDSKTKILTGVNKTKEAAVNTSYILNPLNTISVNIIYSSVSGINNNKTNREYINMNPTGISSQSSESKTNSYRLSIDIKHTLNSDSLYHISQRFQIRNNGKNIENISSYTNSFPSDELKVSGTSHNNLKSNNTTYSYLTDFLRKLNNSKGIFTQSISAQIGNSRDFFDYLSIYNHKSGDSSFITTINNINPIKNKNAGISAISTINYKITKIFSLTGFYSVSYSRASNNNRVFDKDSNNIGQIKPVDSLDNIWKYTFRQNFISLGLNTKSKIFEGSIYLNWLIRNQVILPITTTPLSINWNFLYPRIDLTYYLNPSTSIAHSFYYEPITISPSQLLTTQNFQNPLIIQTGNPDLRNPIKRTFVLRFSRLDTKTLSNFITILLWANTNKKIINNVIFDSLGRQVLTPINLDHSRMLSWGTTWSKPFFKRRLVINLNNNVLYANDPVSVSGILGTSESLSITPRVSINYTKKELIDIQSSFSANRTYSTYNIGKITKNEVSSFNMNLDVTGYLPLGFIAGVKYNKVVTSGLSAGYNRSVDLLNVFLSKRLLKNKMEIKAQGFDILNNNNSFSRTFTPTYFEDTQNTVLQRFFMGSIIYYIK